MRGEGDREGGKYMEENERTILKYERRKEEEENPQEKEKGK